MTTLIIGAGPTGLTLACELMRRGVTVRIIDRLETPTTQSRALGVQARTLEVFEKIGILDEILSEGVIVDTVHLYEYGKQIGMTSLAGLPTMYPFLLVIPQAQTEKILAEHLRKLGGRIERNVSLEKLDNDQAVLSTGETVTAKWIIGCDGAHSTVRHCLNLEFKGTKFSEIFALADVEIDDLPLEKQEIHAFLSRQGIIGIISLPTPNHYRLVMTFPSSVPSLDIPLLERTVLERTTHALSIQKIDWASSFTIHRRIVSQMSKGNVFLCGDAAHIHSPAGGQGLNIGIQDAFNLAWKLALVHHGDAHPELLQTYHEERYPVALHTLWGTTLATFFIAAPYPWLRKFFFKTLSRLFKWKFFRLHFSAALAEINTNYRHSSLSWQSWKDFFWKGPQPGDRAPFLENPQEICFTLLIFGAPHFKPDLNNKLFSIQYYSLESSMSAHYKVKKSCLYLIRPDGYIAFRSRTLNKRMKNKLHLVKIVA